MYLPLVAADLSGNCWQQGNDKAQDSLAFYRLDGSKCRCTQSCHPLLPPPLSPAQAPCSSSIRLQPHPQLVSVCSQSLLPSQVFHPSFSTSMEMPVIASQAQNQSSLYHSYSLNCSCSTQRPWLYSYCFNTRLLPHQQESSIYTKKPTKAILCSFLVYSKSCTNVFNVWGCQDVWVTGLQTVSKISSVGDCGFAVCNGICMLSSYFCYISSQKS